MKCAKKLMKSFSMIVYSVTSKMKYLKVYQMLQLLISFIVWRTFEVCYVFCNDDIDSDIILFDNYFCLLLCILTRCAKCCAHIFWQSDMGRI